MYSQIYLDYVQDIKKGFSLHLVVMIAKENDKVVSACVDCLKKIVDRLCILPEHPEKIGYVCHCFHVFYSGIWSLRVPMSRVKHPPEDHLSSISTLAVTGMIFVTVVCPVS